MYIKYVWHGALVGIVKLLLQVEGKIMHHASLLLFLFLVLLRQFLCLPPLNIYVCDNDDDYGDLQFHGYGIFISQKWGCRG